MYSSGRRCLFEDFTLLTIAAFCGLMWRMMWRCGRYRSRELRRPCEASPP